METLVAVFDVIGVSSDTGALCNKKQICTS